MIDKIVKNKTRLALKLFGLVWLILIVQVLLKLTFNYWQPYVIPTPQLQAISDFVDDHKFFQYLTNDSLYYLNATIMLLCGVQMWWFKNRKQIILFYVLITIFNIMNYNNFLSNITTILLLFVIPLLFDIRKWKTIILTAVLNFVFLFLSAWLSNISNTNELSYVVRIFFNFDYYIMFVLNYFVFNLLRERKEMKNNG